MHSFLEAPVPILVGLHTLPQLINSIELVPDGSALEPSLVLFRLTSFLSLISLSDLAVWFPSSNLVPRFPLSSVGFSSDNSFVLVSDLEKQKNFEIDHSQSPQTVTTLSLLHRRLPSAVCPLLHVFTLLSLSFFACSSSQCCCRTEESGRPSSLNELFHYLSRDLFALS
jgi:hypothetical protein